MIIYLLLPSEQKTLYTSLFIIQPQRNEMKWIVPIGNVGFSDHHNKNIKKTNA